MNRQSKCATVMVVDDNLVNLTIQAYLMEVAGYDVIAVDHPEKVLSILSEQEIDGILMDIEMPGMRGDQLTAVLNKQFPSLPVVALTSTRLDDLVVTNDAHFSAILQKPLTPEKIERSFHLLAAFDADLQGSTDDMHKQSSKTQVRLVETASGKRVFLGSQFFGIYLTIREAELVQLFGDYKYHEIAKLMKISRRTVEYYANNIRKKIRCPSKNKLRALINESGILEQLKELVDIRYLFADDEGNDN